MAATFMGLTAIHFPATLSWHLVSMQMPLDHLECFQGLGGVKPERKAGAASHNVTTPSQPPSAQTRKVSDMLKAIPGRPSLSERVGGGTYQNQALVHETAM